MRPSLLACILTLLACTDPFATATQADTMEAYETYLRENPSGRFSMEAEARLETLMIEKAKQEQSLERYDAYLERFPEGILRERALGEREEVLYLVAKKQNTSESWQKFLDEYPGGDKSRKQFARRMLDVHAVLPDLEIGGVRMDQVNLAEDPEGPLDGWGFEVDVKNKGSKTLADLRMTIQYLSPEGGVLEEREWPLVAEYWPVPIEEEHKLPMKPGQTRTWTWTTGDVPDRWDRKVRVFVSRVSVQGGK